jgi:hypothetical protein
MDAACRQAAARTYESPPLRAARADSALRAKNSHEPCSTNTTVTRILHAILSQPMRLSANLSANPPRPP